MKTRLLTSLAIVLSIVLMLVLKVFVSPYFLDVFFMLIAAVAAFELSKILTRIGIVSNQWLITVFPAFFTTATLLALHFSLGFGWTILLDLGLIVLGALISFLWDVCRRKRVQTEIKLRAIKTNYVKFSLLRSAGTAAGFFYPSAMLLCMIFLNHMGEIGLDKAASFGGSFSLLIILFAFLIPMFTDSFAMLSGMLIGGKKLVPKISPNKTISGAIGGFLWCILLSVCVYLILGSIDYFAEAIANFAIWKMIIIVGIGSVVAQAGDIFESYLKRKASVKDSGNFLPGHGGMLDRVDSNIFVAPYLLLAFFFILL